MENKPTYEELTKRIKELEKKQDIKFKTIVENSLPIIFIIDNNGKFLLSEGKSLKKLGLKPGEIVGQSVYDIYKDYPVIIKHIKNTLIGKQNRDIIEINNLFYDIIYNPYKNSLGDIIGVIGMAVDITELKISENKLIKQNKSLRKAKSKAIESDKLKSTFLANMSHEIRTPLNSIVGFSNLLINNNLNEESKNKYFSYISKSSNNLMKIINDLIDISKIEANQLKIDKENINVKKLLEHIFETFKNEKTFDIDFIYDININENINIFSDFIRLEQILINLISNALKFTEKGYVEFNYTIEKNDIIFYVKDTGIGIDKKNQKLIFDRFRQADGGNNRLYGGNGLGLSISKSLVELLDGKMWLKSEINIGTTFYFKIPINNVKKIDKIQKDKNDNINKNFLNDKTILIAEDKDINYLLVKEMLINYNINLIRVTNGQSAIDEFEKNIDIDLILMDIKMPILDGYSATKKIREIDSNIPIIAITAYALIEDKGQALKIGCSDYIIKPVIKDKLINMIKKYI